MTEQIHEEAPFLRARHERRRLRNEIAGILVLKVAGLVLLSQLFFAGADRVDPAQVGRHVLPGTQSTEK